MYSSLIQKIQLLENGFMIDGKLFDLSFVRHVDCRKLEHKNSAPSVALAFGLIYMLIHLQVGCLIILTALSWVFTIQPNYVITIFTLDGEEQILVGTNKNEMDKIVNALNKFLLVRKQAHTYLTY